MVRHLKEKIKFLSQDLQYAEHLVSEWRHKFKKEYRDKMAVKFKNKDLESKIEEIEKPTHRVIYRPKDDPQRRRHTSWIRWVAAGKPPKDFGEIEKITAVVDNADE